MNVAATKETVILIEQKTICLPKMSHHNSKKKSQRHQEHATLMYCLIGNQVYFQPLRQHIAKVCVTNFFSEIREIRIRGHFHSWSVQSFQNNLSKSTLELLSLL